MLDKKQNWEIIVNCKLIFLTKKIYTKSLAQ